MKFSRLSFVAFTLCATALTASAGNLKGGADLVRPSPAADPDARGRIRVSAKSHDGEIKFDAQRLDLALTVDVFMEDAAGSGVFVLFGTMAAGDAAGDYALKVQQKDGPLPLGATEIADYADREVEVRSGATVLLHGLAPLPQKIQGKKGFKKEKDDLALPVAPPQPAAKGRVEAWKKLGDGRQRLRVQAEHLAPGTTLDLMLETALGSGVFASAGSLVVGEEGGELKLFLDTHQGDPLPNGAFSVDELAGLQLQLVDASLAVVLEGVVPAVQ